MTTTSEIWRPPTEFAEDLKERYGLVCPPRWGTPRNPERKSLGPKLWKVMEKLGAPPMPWQKYVTDVALELDENGVFVHREAGLSVSRQQGKTELILGLQVHRAMAWHRQNIIYAAQDRNMARQRWEDEFWEKISDSADLAKRARIRKSNGNEKILWPATRSRMGITANTESAGHGPALDLGIIDEAFKHEDDRLEQAFSPAMTTRPMAQLWWASAGGTTKSVWLNKKRKIGRALIEAAWKSGVWPGVCYFEWFAPEDMPRDDPATWHATLPALGHTVTEAVIAAELVKLDPAEFDRAYLNRTRKPTPPTDPNVPKGKWPGLVDAKSKPVADSVALAIDVSQDRSRSAISAASLRPDGKVHLEVVAYRPGTDWVVPAVVKLHSLWNPVAVAVAASGAPASSLIDDLVAAGIDVPKDKEHPQRGDLAVMRSGDIIEACGQMADAMNQGTARHIDQVPLTAAVNGARTRRNGDAWTLDRTSSLTEVSPFAAATFARWALIIRGPHVIEDYDPLDSIY